MMLPFRSPWLPALLTATALTLTACGGSGGDGPAPTPTPTPTPTPPPKYLAEISRTSFGVPHIKASDEGGLAFGVAYAYAQDNVCQFAEEIATVNGERSRYWGADGLRTGSTIVNLQADFFYKFINDSASVATALQSQPAPMRAMIDGYVAGYNHYLDTTAPALRPPECAQGGWVRKIDANDMIKLLRRYAAEGGAGQFIGAMMAAVPPASAAAASQRPPAPDANPMRPAFWKALREQTGSNAVALGKDATENGQGMLLGNPHFPWRGSLRFYQLHLTIPGKMNVMGAALGGMPLVNIGFNQDLAWSHTVNTSAHFTVHALQLDPADPTAYLVDGKRQAMTRRSISVDVRNDAGTGPKTESRDFYLTQYGPVVAIPGTLNWTSGGAYALRDANLDNHRLIEQWYAMNTARSLDEFKGAIDRIVGLPWVNTLAVDKAGSALFMDVTVVPNVSAAKQASCVPAPFRALAAGGVFVLNGASAACAPDSDPAAPQPGIFAGASLPRLVRSDYVQNSNDSAWLSNPDAPLTGFPAIVSTDGTEQGLRTRAGIGQLRARLDGSDGLPGKKMSVAQLQGIALNNKVYATELAMNAVRDLCADGSTEDLAGACALLASWDRTANLDANMGMVYFTGFWDRLPAGAAKWLQPFNPADPVNTPAGLNATDPVKAAALRAALASSVQDANTRKMAPTLTWGEIQGATLGARKVPVHGGHGRYGIYNAITSSPGADGMRQISHGTSYIQTVTWDASGPQAQAFLTYSQSSSAASPHADDQTVRFSQKAWITQPFTDAQIKADPAYKTVTVSQQ